MDDLISRQATLELLGDEPEVWTNSDYELGAKNQYLVDKSVIETVPSAEPQWIPCSERLPVPNVYVLMTTAWGSVTIGERIYPPINNTVYFIHDGNTNAELDDVVAWMPLPEPWKDGEKE